VDDFLAALGLVFVIEGALYVLFPETMKLMMLRLSGQPALYLRAAGLAAAVIGVALVWLVRG
jgi:uncharacterized protein